MKKCRNSFPFASLLCGGAFLALAACGDDVTKVSNITHEVLGVDVVETADSLKECNSLSLGKTSYIQDEAIVYVCSDSGWSPVGEMVKGSSCYVESVSDSSAYKVICGEDSVGVLTNGGNGSSCNVEALSDGSGYKVVCGGDSVGVVLNGQKGADANACSFSDDGNGTLTQTCGSDSVSWYKAVCGTDPYEPSREFCFMNSLYALCDGSSYNPEKEFCFEGVIYDLCGKAEFNPTKKFCDVRDSSLYAYSIFNGNAPTTPAVTIMAENLHYNVDGSRCFNDSACNEYGRYYSWNMAAEGNICPDGWHLPDTVEWRTYIVQHILYSGDYGKDSVGYALKAKTGWNDITKDGVSDTLRVGNGDNYMGFNALPAGVYTAITSWTGEKESTYFWTSTPNGGDAYAQGLFHYTGILDGSSMSKSVFMSVRCAKDVESN